MILNFSPNFFDLYFHFRQELVNPSKQEVLASSTVVLVNATKTLLSTSQEFMQKPDEQTVKVC